MAPFIFFSPPPKPSYSGWCNSQLNEATLGMLDWIHKRETCLDVLFLLTLSMHQQNWVGPDDAIYLHLSITFNCSHKLRQGRTGTEGFCTQVPSVISRNSQTWSEVLELYFPSGNIFFLHLHRAQLVALSPSPVRIQKRGIGGYLQSHILHRCAIPRQRLYFKVFHCFFSVIRAQVSWLWS